jgi:glycosyltransferase involved in cell wall biosynthesis
MVAGYHFFNGITPVKKPWVVTFEESLPRKRLFDDSTAKMLASNYCRAIIAISHRAFDIQNYFLNNHELGEIIKEKMFILRPPQEILIGSADEKDFYNKILTVTFIGRHFYRKGGLEVLRAINKMSKPIILNVISSLELDDWRNDFITSESEREARELLKLSNVKYFRSLENNDCITLLKESHLVVMPSYGETYGYSILEGMAAGCVPIVTNISAFREFTNPLNSFIIDLELVSRIDVDCQLDVDNPMPNKLLFERNSETIENMVYDILCNAVSNRDILKTKSVNCVDWIKQNHDPLVTAMKLEEIYAKFICQ